MGLQFIQADFLRLFRHFNMDRKHKDGKIYVGMGNDGVYRTCKLDFHTNSTQVATGTAEKMAKDLGFKNTRELKDYMDKNL